MKRPSDMLKNIMQTPEGVHITMGDFVDRLGEQSFALAILVLALPNALPLPGIPGFSTITGIPIIFMALQLLWGRKVIWLPHKVASKPFQHRRMMKILTRALPVVVWLEKFLHPRLTMLCDSMGKRVIGLFIAGIGFILALPLLGANFLPGFSISLLALALLEKDGLFAAFSLIFSLVTLYLMYLLIVFAGDGALEWITDLYGWI